MNKLVVRNEPLVIFKSMVHSFMYILTTNFNILFPFYENYNYK